MESGRGLIAELGCGTGKMTRRLAAAGYDMIGIDSSCEMLSVAMEGQDPAASSILYLNQDRENLNFTVLWWQWSVSRFDELPDDK